MALIFIVEDDSDIRRIESIALKNGSHTVEAFSAGKDFFSRLENTMPDLVILDILLPDENGDEILEKLRAKNKTAHLPVIMVTAKSTEMDLLRALDEGADDYIKKPFSVMELIGRVNALLRRTQPEKNEVLCAGKITLDQKRHTVCAGEKSVELTYKEYELLRFLMNNLDAVLSRETIMSNVWGTDFFGESRTVDMHIKTLRQKLGKEGAQICTVRNVGYVIHSEEKNNEA